MNIEYCRRCTLPGTYPGADLADGICTFCRRVPDQTQAARRQDERMAHARTQVEEAFAQARGRAWFDCIVCYSGGKDSTYVLQQIVDRYRLRPLAITIDNGFITPTARKNISRVVSHLGVEHHNLTIGQDFMQRLVSASLFEDLSYGNEYKRLSSVCASCIFLVNTMAIRYALEYEAPLIIAGFTAGQVPACVYSARRTALDDGRVKRIQRMEEVLGGASRAYFSIDEERLRAAEPYPIHVNPLMAESYREEAVLEQVRQIGWAMPDDTGKCSTNCGLNCLGTHSHFTRYGFNPYAREISDLVRTGAVSHERGMEMMLDVSFSQGVEQCLDKLGIDPQEYLAKTGASSQ